MSETLTTRQRIVKLLRDRPSMRPTAISDALDDYGIELTPQETCEQVEEINDTIDAQILVAPPECKSCGFDGFDHLANIPSTCPDCRSEWIEEPVFKLAQ